MHLLLSRRVVATRLVFGEAHSCLYDIIIALFLLAFFLARATHNRSFRLVGDTGLEPAAKSLEVSCSSIELIPYFDYTKKPPETEKDGFLVIVLPQLLTVLRVPPRL